MKKLLLLLFLYSAALTTVGQRDDVNPNGNRPADTAKPRSGRMVDTAKASKKPSSTIIVDTTRPVPVETKTLVRSVLRLKRILITKDALAICRILNAEIYQHDSTLSNHTIVLPDLPDMPKDERKSLRNRVKADADSDPAANNEFERTALQFDTLANLFSASEITLTDNDTGSLIRKINMVLPPLARNAKVASGNTRRKSGATVRTLNKSVVALNKMLQRGIDSSRITRAFAKKIYSLMFDVNILNSSIDDNEVRMDTSLLTKTTNSPTLYLAAAYTISAGSSTYDVGDDEPSRFNIYIFRKSLLDNGDKEPEMNMYTVSYVIPALADDPDAWETIQKPASTTGASFPPARFKFRVRDNRTGKSYESTEDLFNAQKEPDQKWSLMDLIDPHPLYRIMFLIP